MDLGPTASSIEQYNSEPKTTTHCLARVLKFIASSSNRHAISIRGGSKATTKNKGEAADALEETLQPAKARAKEPKALASLSLFPPR
jgi:hypothetical protein